jgi:hypothetical protein
MANRRAYRPDRHVYRRLRMNTVGQRGRLRSVIVGAALLVVVVVAYGLRLLLRD